MYLVTARRILHKPSDFFEEFENVKWFWIEKLKKT